MAKLKRRLADQDRAINALTGRRSPAPKLDAQADPGGPRHRITADGVKALRSRLGLSAGQLGSLVGVSGQTIYLWERGKIAPRAKRLGVLVKLRGMGKKEVQALFAG